MTADLFGFEAPAASPRRGFARSQADGEVRMRPWPTDAECRTMERALTRFQAWFLPASLETLTKADAADLAARYPPIEAADIQQMLDVRMLNLRRKR